MFGLNIHLKSFKLNQSIVKDNDKIRVSITTFPEQNKEFFVTDMKQTFCVHHFFTVNVSEKTEKIVFVFRKKGIFEDSIIASTTIFSKDVALTKRNNQTEITSFKIYEPIQNCHKNRRVYGEMQVQFSLTSAFPTFSKKESNGSTKNNNKNNSEISKIQKSAKINGYYKLNDTN